MIMANTAAVYARIDPQLKQDVEAILNQLNVTPSALIQMLYGQIKLTNSIPFDIKLPNKRPVFIDELTKEELNKELDKGINDIDNGDVYSFEDVKKLLRKELGI